MTSEAEQQHEQVGYGSPPKATRFQKGRSGNPKGRPRNRRRDVPYDTLLGQMVTVREDGRERRVTAAEAFILQLTKKGLEGDSASARAGLAAIENARAARQDGGDFEILHVILCTFGAGSVAESYGLGVRIHAASKEQVRFMLKPWIVEAALERMGDRRLTIDEQRIVIASVQRPQKVSWPEWWAVRSP